MVRGIIVSLRVRRGIRRGLRTMLLRIARARAMIVGIPWCRCSGRIVTVRLTLGRLLLLVMRMVSRPSELAMGGRGLRGMLEGGRGRVLMTVMLGMTICGNEMTLQMGG